MRASDIPGTNKPDDVMRVFRLSRCTSALMTTGLGSTSVIKRNRSAPAGATSGSLNISIHLKNKNPLHSFRGMKGVFQKSIVSKTLDAALHPRTGERKKESKKKR
jgi:hypothetical protein